MRYVTHTLICVWRIVCKNSAWLGFIFLSLAWLDLVKYQISTSQVSRGLIKCYQELQKLDGKVKTTCWESKVDMQGLPMRCSMMKFIGGKASFCFLHCSRTYLSSFVGSALPHEGTQLPTNILGALTGFLGRLKIVVS